VSLDVPGRHRDPVTALIVSAQARSEPLSSLIFWCGLSLVGLVIGLTLAGERKQDANVTLMEVVGTIDLGLAP
jgi:hypothetical protein